MGKLLLAFMKNELSMNNKNKLKFILCISTIENGAGGKRAVGQDKQPPTSIENLSFFLLTEIIN